jgi:capsular polysaccharide transport system permease protein
MLICWGGQFSPLVHRFLHPVTYILMPLSGAFFILKWIPNPYRTWLSWSPLTQMFEMVRRGQFESFESPYIHPLYIISWCLVLTWAGMVALRVTRRHVHLH